MIEFLHYTLKSDTLEVNCENEELSNTGLLSSVHIRT